jgi:hypothetical protein
MLMLIPFVSEEPLGDHIVLREPLILGAQQRGSPFPFLLQSLMAADCEVSTIASHGRGTGRYGWRDSNGHPSWSTPS